MTQYNLVTAGDRIKVWKDGKLVDQFIAHDSATSQVHWSPDGNFLATSSKTGEKITVSHFKCLRATIEMKSDNAQTFVRYGNTSSRYVATCGKQSQVLLWDVKSRKIRKEFNTAFDAVTCLGFNTNDTHIACGSSNGSTVFINIKSGVRNQTMVTSKKKPIYALSFNNIKNSVLGTVSEDGSFNLWNVNQEKLIHSFERAHLAPATSLAFSPVNDMLAVTVGFDKRFILYDIKNKKTLRVNAVTDPLTCLDFADGEKLAIGTMTGDVLMIDLRASSAPFKIFSASDSEITSLHFQKFNTITKEDLDWNVDEIMAEANVRLQLNSGDVEESNINYTKEMDVTKIFSPLQDTSPCHRPYNVLNESPLCTPDLIDIRSPKHDARTVSFKNQSDFNLSVPEGFSAKNLAYKTVERKTVVSPLPMVQFKDETQSSFVALNDPNEDTQQQQDEASASSSTSAHLFNTNLLKNIVMDAMEDCKEALHKDVVNLHVEMIKKFHLQRIQMQQMFQHYSINEELLAEIEKLREENARLRMNY